MPTICAVRMWPVDRPSCSLPALAMSHSPGHEGGHFPRQVGAVVVVGSQGPQIPMTGEALDGPDVAARLLEGLGDRDLASSAAVAAAKVLEAAGMSVCVVIISVEG